jgi:hypothetical protein
VRSFNAVFEEVYSTQHDGGVQGVIPAYRSFLLSVMREVRQVQHRELQYVLDFFQAKHKFVDREGVRNEIP